jgi:signal transduction histidine kinase
MTVTTPIKYNDEIKGATVISVSIDSIFEDIQDLKRQLILISFIAGILAVMLSFFMGNKLSKPIEKLTIASEEIRKGKLDVRVDINRKDEIGRLAESFNQMSIDFYNIDINRRQFVSNISHELNTPLTSIKALIESLIDGDDDVSVYKEYLKDVNSEVDRLSMLIKALLTISRFEEMELHKEPVNLYDEIEALSRLFSSLLKKNDMILNNYCDNTILIKADRGMLREVLINLIGNSIKYGKEKGTIDISCHKNHNITLTIKDNGIGIPEKDISFIFDLFFKVDKSRRGGTGERGIGLYIVKKIITLHGWAIQANSILGEKTEFLISINE